MKTEMEQNEEQYLHPGGAAATIALGKMAEIQPEMRVLDAGTGYGAAGKILAKTFGCVVLGIDNDPEKQEACEKSSRPGDLFSFQLTDAYNMDLKDSIFDVVLRQYSVYGGEETKFIQECHRVLKENGLLAFNGTFKTINFKNMEKRSLEDFTLQEYERLLTKSGFEVLEVETEQSTQELLDSYRNKTGETTEHDDLMIRVIDNNMVKGFKLTARKVSIQSDYC